MELMSRAFPRSARVPAVLLAIVILFTITLTVLWNVVLVHDYIRIRDLARQETEYGGAFHWTFIALGSSLFLAILVLLVVFASRLFAEIKWSRLTSGFVASVSHELNSPLSSIKLHAQTLVRPGIGDADRVRFASFVLADVERLSGLIANVLRAAQIDQHRLALSLREVKLRGWLEDYVRGARTTMVDRFCAASERRAEIAAAAAADAAEAGALADVVVRIDPVVFRQVLDNLVDNALKYSKDEGTRIVVRMGTVRDGRVAIEVEDDGIGMPPKELRRVFDRFYRIESDDPARSRKGTGLGLSIVKSIVEAHGGTVGARSEGPGRGSTIRIELPVITGAGAEAPAAAGRPAATADVAAGSQA
jgi:signal transduction histidine kinase